MATQLKIVKDANIPIRIRREDRVVLERAAAGRPLSTWIRDTVLAVAREPVQTTAQEEH